MLTDNFRLEIYLPSLELSRISNQTLKGVIEVNYWKSRSELCQPSEVNYAV